MYLLLESNIWERVLLQVYSNFKIKENLTKRTGSLLDAISKDMNSILGSGTMAIIAECWSMITERAAPALVTVAHAKAI